jgi:hypothetical protein
VWYYSSGDKSDDTKDSFFEELQHVFYQFSKYCMKILEDSNAENVKDMFSK